MVIMRILVIAPSSAVTISIQDITTLIPVGLFLRMIFL